jgi:hypothetical protein
MALANNIQMPVFNVNGSLNSNALIIVNTIAPIPNPINRLGQISPLYAPTKFSTDLINAKDIGTAPNKSNAGYF